MYTLKGWILHMWIIPQKKIFLNLKRGQPWLQIPFGNVNVFIQIYPTYTGITLLENMIIRMTNNKTPPNREQDGQWQMHTTYTTEGNGKFSARPFLDLRLELHDLLDV